MISDLHENDNYTICFLTSPWETYVVTILAKNFVKINVNTV